MRKLIYILICLSLIQTAYAANYYVATWGTNASAGTLAEPWANISYAATQISAGDTVFLINGTWNNEEVTISDSLVNFTAYNGTPTMIDTSPETLTAFYMNGVNDVTINSITIQSYRYGIEVGATYAKNMTFKNNHIMLGYVSIEQSMHGIYLLPAADAGNYAYNFTISGNTIEGGNCNPTHSAVDFIDWGLIHSTGLEESNVTSNILKASTCSGFILTRAHDNQFEDNTVQNLSRGFSNFPGNEQLGSNNTLENNSFLDLFDRGIRTDYHGKNTWITNNTIKNVTGGAINLYSNNTAYIYGNYIEDGGEYSLWTGPVYDTIFSHNVWNCSGSQPNLLPDIAFGNNRNVSLIYNDFVNCNNIRLDDLEDSVIKNNIFVDSGTLTIIHDIGGNTVSYNLRHNTGISGLTDTNYITDDPLFVDAGNEDFHLQAGSPAIGAGESGVDMGAYPYGDDTTNATADTFDVWLDNVDLGADTTDLFYNFTPLLPNTAYNISIRSHNLTYDSYSTWVNQTITTNALVAESLRFIRRIIIID